MLINNAGRVAFKSLLDTSDEDWDGLMATNARGPFVHCRAALPHLERSPAGAIVNVASISGVVGLADQSAYCATKGAVVQLTRALAVECAGRGVRVNAIAPGAIGTPLLLDALRASGELEAGLRQVAAHHPLGRIASAAEIAEVVVFLASPRASFMTGFGPPTAAAPRPERLASTERRPQRTPAPLTAVRTEGVGSMLRGAELLSARRRHESGELSHAEFKRIEDRAVSAAIRLQEEVGIGVLSDGELRRRGWMSHFFESVDGFQPGAGPSLPWRGGEGELPPELRPRRRTWRAPGARCGGRAGSWARR